MKIRTQLSRNLIKLGISAGLLTAHALFGGDAKSPLIVAYNPKLEYSRPIWEAFASRTNDPKFPFALVECSYLTPQELVQKLKTIDLPSTTIVIGPARSSDATFLNESLNEYKGKYLFISPSISTTGSYSGLEIIRGCLTDDRRINGLNTVAPKEWKGMSTAFVGEDDEWGRQLFDSLTNSMAFTRTGESHFVATQSRPAADYARIAKLCKEHQRGHFSCIKQFTRDRRFFEQGGEGESMAHSLPANVLLTW
jgi:hypothetical protein